VSVVVPTVHPLIVLHCSHATIVGVTGKFCLICLVCARAYIGTLPTLSPFRDFTSLSMQLAFKNSYFQAHILYLSFFISLSLSLSLYRVTSLFTNKGLYTNLQGICTFQPLTLLNQSGVVVYVSKRRDCKKEREFVCVLPHCERRDKVHGCTFLLK